jgi:hypothetical protein
LAPSSNVFLVLADEMNPLTARPLLNGLAPFLGSEGGVAAASGRYDRSSVQEEAPLAYPVQDWWKSVGHEMGYATGSPPVGLQEYHSNWILFKRVPQDIVWNRQWMFLPGDVTPGIGASIN